MKHSEIYIYIYLLTRVET